MVISHMPLAVSGYHIFVKRIYQGCENLEVGASSLCTGHDMIDLSKTEMLDFMQGGDRGSSFFI